MTYQSDLELLKAGLGNKKATIKSSLVKQLGHEEGVLSQFILYKKGKLWLPHVVSVLGEHHVATDDGFSICFIDGEILTAEILSEKCGWDRSIEIKETTQANFLTHRLVAESAK
ncbi:hypothetical protein [Aeromonas sanarellii]|uniref:hypothetical protein n=1 Tax=Aeromonas sanarellii TaxID=633415 RepID=UPI003B9DE6C7